MVHGNLSLCMEKKFHPPGCANGEMEKGGLCLAKTTISLGLERMSSVTYSSPEGKQATSLCSQT